MCIHQFLIRNNSDDDDDDYNDFDNKSSFTNIQTLEISKIIIIMIRVLVQEKEEDACKQIVIFLYL